MTMRALSCVLATAALVAAEPGVTVELAPGPELREAWSAGPHARWLADRAVAAAWGATVADLARRGQPLLDTTGARLEGDARGVRWTIACPTPAAAQRWVEAAAELRRTLAEDAPVGPLQPRVDGSRVVAASGDPAPRPALARTHHVQMAADLPAMPGLPLRIEGWADLIPAGSRERVEASWPELAAALRPVDPGVASALPAGTLACAAVGVDGPSFVRWLATVAAGSAPDLDAAVAASGLGADLADLGPLLTGTWTLAILPGAPFPEVLLDAPRDPQHDERILALCSRIPGWSADGEGPWMVTLPGAPLPLTVAREPGRWRFQVGGTGTAPAGGGVAVPATAAAWVSLDLARIAQAVPAWAALATRDRQALTQIRAAAQAARILEPQVFALARTAGDGVRLDARGPAGLLAAPTLLALALPAIGQTREMAMRAKTGNNAKQMVVCLIAYASDNGGRLPADLDELIPWSQGDVTERMFRSAAGERLGLPTPHFRYLRPASEAGFRTAAAIVVEDPACNRGRGCVVGFGDGHYEWIPAPRSAALWAAIQERPLDHLWTPQESSSLPGLHE
ncbi:MAG: hypothetical protein RLZZ127_3343 [Planctomycetota bacterium]|jgi:hypothetical protein